MAQLLNVNLFIVTQLELELNAFNWLALASALWPQLLLISISFAIAIALRA